MQQLQGEMLTLNDVLLNSENRFSRQYKLLLCVEFAHALQSKKKENI
jgi:hypothetical protein